MSKMNLNHVSRRRGARLRYHKNPAFSYQRQHPVNQVSMENLAYLVLWPTTDLQIHLLTRSGYTVVL